MNRSVRLVKFNEDARKTTDAFGLHWHAIENAFLCDQYSSPSDGLLPGVPIASALYQRRESKASGQASLSIKKRSFEVFSPWTGKRLATSLTLTFPWQHRLNSLNFVPLIYAFDEGDELFYAVTCGLTGRIVHIFLPSIDLALYEISEARARAIDLEFGFNETLLIQQRSRQYLGSSVPVIAIVDMATNYGHQMINHLSGIDILIRDRCEAMVDEYWVVGHEFFGSLSLLYPEINGRVRCFESRAALSAEILEKPVLAVRLGFNAYLRETHERITKLAAEKYHFPQITGRFPVIAVTIRTGERRCINLSDALKTIYDNLISIYPTLGFVIDGWVFAERDVIDQSCAITCVNQKFIARIRDEAATCREAVSKIPPEAIVRNLIGRSILESISGLTDVDCYFAHVGTLQHKIAFSTLVPGVVHGPVAQLKAIDSGAFQSELGYAPAYLPPAAVEDVGAEFERGPSVSDYIIIDCLECARLLKGLISNLGITELRPSALARRHEQT